MKSLLIVLTCLALAGCATCVKTGGGGWSCLGSKDLAIRCSRYASDGWWGKTGPCLSDKLKQCPR